MSAEFLNALKRILTADEIIDDSALEPMLIDERKQFRGRALIAVQPRSTENVAAIIRLCKEHCIAVVPQGGNTGYCGGATPDTSGTQLLLSLRRLNRCRWIDPDTRCVTVEAGMILENLQQLADVNDLLFPLSMGSQGSCQIGGNLATNAGGLAVLRYGTARDLVLGLEVVTPNGEILDELKSLRKDNTGYDLKHLFIGAEGTLGIITAASLKLFPKPSVRVVAWLALPSIEILAPLLLNLQRSVGDCVSSFEYISAASLGYVLKNVPDTRSPTVDQDEHSVLVEFSGFGDAEPFQTLCQNALICAQQENLIRDAVFANSLSQSQSFWQLRETIPRAEKLMGGSIKHDVSVPISRMAQLIEQLKPAIVALAKDARLSIYGHVGDGNIHFNVLPPEATSIESFKQAKGEEISAAIHDLAAEFAGSFSAEHGVGQLKAGELVRYASPERLALMRTLKQALDPANIMNPGKVLRTS